MTLPTSHLQEMYDNEGTGNTPLLLLNGNKTMKTLSTETLGIKTFAPMNRTARKAGAMRKTQNLLKRSSSVLFAGCMLSAMASQAHAQAPGTVPSVQWSPQLGVPAMGRGLEIQPNNILLVGGVGTQQTGYRWMPYRTKLEVMNYLDLSETLNKLHVNAWVEANSFAASGKFTMDFKQFSAYQGNHRHWEIDASTDWIASLPAPVLSAGAKSLASNPRNFEMVYGNYAITGIKYRRRIAIKWDVQYSRNVSEAEFAATISGSSSIYSGGASVNLLAQQLSSMGRTTVTVEVYGETGGTILSAAIDPSDVQGGTNALNKLVSVVQSKLARWDVAPTSPLQAGYPDEVFLTPYKSIPGAPNVLASFAPNQDNIARAIALYNDLDQKVSRLTDISKRGNSLQTQNPRLYKYLFGQTNPTTHLHIPNTGKYDEAVAKRNLSVLYLKGLLAGTPEGSPNDFIFQFDDPDMVKWRVVDCLTDGNNGYPIIELYTNAQVKPYGPGSSYQQENYWGVGLKDITAANGSTNELFTRLVGPPISESTSYTRNLDPVTGIPHRYMVLQYRGIYGADTRDAAIYLVSPIGEFYYQAIDWNGWASPQIVIPKSAWRKIDNGQLLNILLGLRD